MKALLLSLTLLGLSLGFSFNKMSDVILYKMTKVKKSPYGTKYLRIPVTDGLKYSDLESQLNLDEFYHAYIYDHHSKFGLSTLISCADGYNLFDLLKNNPFDTIQWEQFVSANNNRFAKIKSFYNHLNDNSIEKLNNAIESKKTCNPFRSGFKVAPINLRKISLSKEIQILNDNGSVTLIKNFPNGTKKTVPFQEALLKYARQYNSFDDKFMELYSKIQGNAEPLYRSRENEINYTNEQVKLIEKSKILAVWAVHSKSLSKKEKDSNHILIGYAFDTRDNKTYHWVTNLGQSIEVLFDIKY